MENFVNEKETVKEKLKGKIVSDKHWVIEAEFCKRDADKNPFSQKI